MKIRTQNGALVSGNIPAVPGWLYFDPYPNPSLLKPLISSPDLALVFFWGGSPLFSTNEAKKMFLQGVLIPA